MKPRISTRRVLANVAIAVTAATASVAGVSLAQGSIPKAGTPAAATSAPGGLLAGVHTALEALVSTGAINQPQADAVQQQADSGSIDPKTLVQSGALSDSQMRIVANRIDELKQAGG